MPCRETTQREKGAVLVEMAFALPLLALIFLGIIDLGLMVRQHQVLQNAAREGARISVFLGNQIFFRVPPCTAASAIKQRVVDYCLEEKIAVDYCDISIDQVYRGNPSNPDPDCASLITVSYTRPMLLMGAPFLPFGTMTLTGSAVFTNFYGCTSTTYPAAAPAGCPDPSTGAVCQ